MNQLNLQDLSPQDLILHFVLECRGAGHFLPYSDYQIIDEWLQAATDPDVLLLVLSEVLPKYFTAAGGSKRAKPLSGARKMVLRRISDQRMRGVP